MTDTIQASRQLVLARLGSPLPELPGETYQHRTPERGRIYARYGQFVDQAFMNDQPEQALESFVAFLEAERETNYEAFYFGRELLLADLPVDIEYPSDDPDPAAFAPASTTAERRELPGWSRRKPARRKPASRKIEQLRARVLERLGRPHGQLPGECVLLTSSPALDQVEEYFEPFEYAPINERQIDRAIERLAALREYDWQAFYHGRERLLSLLPVKLELPKPPAPGTVEEAEPSAAALG